MRFFGRFLLASSWLSSIVAVATADPNDDVCSGLSTAPVRVTISVAPSRIQSQLDALVLREQARRTVEALAAEVVVLAK